MGNQIQKVLCCNCCRKSKEKTFNRNISIRPKNKDLQELLLPISSEDYESRPIINNLSEFKFDTSNCILKHHCDPSQFYEFDPIEDKIGEGAFGVVYRVKSKKFKFIRAMKKIAKAKLINPNDSESFVNEIKILQKLEHPNVIKIYELFEDEKSFFIVTEYIGEGNLLNKIEAMKDRDEVIIGIIMNQIISAVAYLHKNNTVHGDLKPENIMISSSNMQARYSFNTSAKIDMQDLDKICKSSSAAKSNSCESDLRLLTMKKFYFKHSSNFQIKLIDFGCSKVLTRRHYKYEDQIGTCHYMSPEVAQNNYNEKCDLWSCGVIMHVLLSGYFPFAGETDKEIENNILNYNFSLEIPEFQGVSRQAKDLIKKLMTYDPNERISAMEALNHPFFIDNFDRNNIFNEDIDCQGALQNMRNFKTGLLFTQMMNGFISYNFISEIEIANLRKVFKLLDTNGDGMLSKEELIKGYKDAKITLSEEDLDEFLKRIDNNFNGLIEFEEFIRACSDKKKLLSDENLRIAFDILDADKSGEVSKEEIKHTFFENSKISDNVLDEFLKQINKDDNENITFEDFKKIMSEIK